MRWVVFLIGLEIVAISINFFYGPINVAAGGTTVFPMIFKKYFYIDPAIGLLAVDMIVIFMNIFVDGWNTFLAAFSQVVTVVMMNYTETGFDKKYQVRVMSNDHLEEIRDLLQKEYQGLTIYNVVGGYSEDRWFF